MNLTALQHSAFLQSLGWAITNSLWQSAALWMIYYLINGLYKNASAKFKNNFSTILLFSAFAIFCATLFYKYFAIESITTHAVPDALSATYTTPVSTSSHYNWNIFLNKLSQALPYLSAAYLLLLVLLSVRLINSYRFTNFIKTNGLQKPAVEWKLFTQKVAMHLGITKKIVLWTSAHIDVPATIGFFKPVILIPLASINQLSANQLEAIILHELSHIKRNDYLVNLFISIIETILFFNPFILLLSKIIKRERENCCDDFVIQYQYDRHSYASALLSLEQYRSTNFRLALAATSGKKQLLKRIKRIMEISKGNTNFNYGQKLLALLFITGIICSIAWLSPERNSSVAKAANKTIIQKNKIENKKRIAAKPNDVTSKFKWSKFSFENLTSKNITSQISTKSNSCKKDNQDKAMLVMNAPSSCTFPKVSTIPYAPVVDEMNDEVSFKNNTQQLAFADAPQLIREKQKLNTGKKDKHITITQTFDDDIQDNVRAQLEALQNQLSTEKFKYYFNERLETVLNNSLKNFDEKKLNRQIRSVLKIAPQPKIHNFSHGPDSLFAKSIVMLNNHRRIAELQNNSVAQILPAGRTNINIHNSSEGFSFHMNLNNPANGDAKRNRKNLPQDNLSIQYANGVLVINGEAIHLPDNKKLFAQLRSKKLIPAEDTNGLEFGTDD